MTYQVRFFGRRVGDLGITYPITMRFQAFNDDEAIESIYSHYEHIHDLERWIDGEWLPIDPSK